MYYNLIMALVIAGIIMILALIKNTRLQAIVYGLPIPVTAALLAVGGSVDSTHIVGLLLLCGFLWSVYWLSHILSVLWADIASAGLYIVMGFLAVHMLEGLEVSFMSVIVIYIVLWLIFFLRVDSPQASKQEKHQINLPTKGLTTTGVAWTLLTAKDILGGIVVTFPFSGVFAVLEMKNGLHVLAHEFTKNSLAFVVFFIVVHFAEGYGFGLLSSISFGWIGYLLVLYFLTHTQKTA